MGESEHRSDAFLISASPESFFPKDHSLRSIRVMADP